MRNLSLGGLTALIVAALTWFVMSASGSNKGQAELLNLPPRAQAVAKAEKPAKTEDAGSLATDAGRSDAATNDATGLAADSAVPGDAAAQQGNEPALLAPKAKASSKSAKVKKKKKKRKKRKSKKKRTKKKRKKRKKHKATKIKAKVKWGG